MHYGVLSGKRYVKKPGRCKIGTKVRIINMHPDDDHFEEKDNWIGKIGKLYPTSREKLYAQTEQVCLNPIRRTFLSCNIDFDGKVEYFTAVRIERATASPAQMYKNMHLKRPVDTRLTQP